jgi:hypothetical protein
MSELPRYKLGVGDRLRYRLSSEADNGPQQNGAAGGTHCFIDWDLCVVSRDADGLWRVVFSERRTQEHGRGRGGRTIETIDKDGYFDLAEDGSLVENWTITPLSNPTVFFPRLPADRKELDSGWQSTLELDATQRRYHGADPDGPQSWRFFEDCSTQLDPVYGLSRQRRHLFDMQQGLVANVTSTMHRSWPTGSERAAWSDRISLQEVIKPVDFDPERALEEADRYFDTCREYQRLVDLALWDVARSEEWLHKAEDTLDQFGRSSRSEFIRALLRGKIGLHRAEYQGLVADTKKLSAHVGKPAGDWQAVDLAGEQQSSHHNGGRPLVICFWNRGCAWSLRSLAAIDALAEEMRGRPVGFWGVCMDRRIEDAALVWQSLKLRFPALVDVGGERSVSSAFGIESFPTTVVVDRSGIVRRMRAGYSAELSSRLANELERLIGETSVLGNPR